MTIRSFTKLSYLLCLAGNNNNNPLLSLLGGEYEDEDTSKLGIPPSKLENHSTSDDVSDPAIDKQLDNFLLELGQITGETKKGAKGGEAQKEGVKEGGKEVKEEGDTQSVWQACLDAESNEYYYWNTITDEVLFLLFLPPYFNN